MFYITNTVRNIRLFYTTFVLTIQKRSLFEPLFVASPLTSAILINFDREYSILLTSSCTKPSLGQECNMESILRSVTLLHHQSPIHHVSMFEMKLPPSAYFLIKILLMYILIYGIIKEWGWYWRKFIIKERRKIKLIHA